jgi:hypothetical protein
MARPSNPSHGGACSIYHGTTVSDLCFGRQVPCMAPQGCMRPRAHCEAKRVITCCVMLLPVCDAAVCRCAMGRMTSGPSGRRSTQPRMFNAHVHALRRTMADARKTTRCPRRPSRTVAPEVRSAICGADPSVPALRDGG